jgi:hypothetical protein
MTGGLTWPVGAWEGLALAIDRDILDDLQRLMVTKEQRSLIGFFCAIGPAASAVLEDMALEGRVWPGCEPSLRDLYRRARSKRRKAKRRRSRR